MAGRYRSVASGLSPSRLRRRSRTGDEEDVQVTLIQWLLALAVATIAGAIVTGAIAWWILYA
jgi:hypothetical protein